MLGEQEAYRAWIRTLIEQPDSLLLELGVVPQFSGSLADYSKALTHDALQALPPDARSTAQTIPFTYDIDQVEFTTFRV